MKPCILILCKAPVVRRVAEILSVYNMPLQVLVKTGKALCFNPAPQRPPRKNAAPVCRQKCSRRENQNSV
jgi:hypothetical protein